MRFVLAISGVLLTLSPAAANDASFGGAGADLVPLDEKRIQMVSEDIVFEERAKPQRHWNVRARYVFRNPTASTISLQVGFPEQHCDTDSDDCVGNAQFQQLKTTVRGRAVTHRVGRVSARHTWAPKLGKVYLFTVRFGPKETVKVVHRYRYQGSTDTEGRSLFYVTTTGALWNGPIKKARFVIRPTEQPWTLAWTAGYRMIRNTEKRDKRGHGKTEIVFQMRNWNPKTNLQVHFGHFKAMTERLGLECPAPWTVFDKSQAKDTAEDFAKLSKKALRQCRNMPYARHGYPFKSRDLRRLFYQKPKKTTGTPRYPTADEVTGSHTMWMAFKLNPHWSAKLMTREDTRYVARLLEEEKKRK